MEIENIINDKLKDVEKFIFQNRERFVNANPFPFIIIDDFFSKEFLNDVLNQFPNLAEQKSKDFIGSLFLSLNDYGSPKFCTLNYSGDDAVAAIGYRLLGDEMIPNSALIDYYNEKEITLNHNENDYECALREFCEETGFKSYTLNNIQNIVPYDENFTGSNYKSYKHRYFIMYMKYENSLILNKFQKYNLQ